VGRATKINSITSPELLAQINPQNQRLVKDFLMYLKSIQRADTTIESYKNDLEIFFVWNLQNAGNKFFVDVSKRDIISYQSYLLTENENSPARVRRLKASLSSLSNYIENILDDEYPGFKNIINKIESPVNEPVRQKSVFTEAQIQGLLSFLVENKQYQKACAVALAAYSGARKSELLRFKVAYFDDKNIVFGSLYKTPEKIRTKGRGKQGKQLNKYVLSKKFKPYFDLWMADRAEKGIDGEWLFVNITGGEWQQMQTSTLDTWCDSFSKVLGMPFYWHSMRHMFATELKRTGLPDSVIVSLFGWKNADMLTIYDDSEADENLDKFFSEDGIVIPAAATVKDL